MNASSNGRARRGPRRGILVTLLAIAAAAAVFGAASPASASNVNCAASIGPSAVDSSSTTAAQYSFMCDKDVLSYSIVFNKQLILFDPEVIAYTPAGEGSGELGSCEGSFPGSGIGCTFQSSSCPGASSSSTQCTGKMAPGNTAKGEIEAQKPYCAQTRKQRTLEAWLTVATLQTNASGKTFVITSQPFHLDNDLGCTKPPKAGHSRH